MEEVEVQVPIGLKLSFWRDSTTGVEGRIRAPGLDGFPTRSLYLDGSRDLEGFLREHVPVAQWRRTGRRGEGNEAPKQAPSRPVHPPTACTVFTSSSSGHCGLRRLKSRQGFFDGRSAATTNGGQRTSAPLLSLGGICNLIHHQQGGRGC